MKMPKMGLELALMLAGATSEEALRSEIGHLPFVRPIHVPDPWMGLSNLSHSFQGLCLLRQLQVLQFIPCPYCLTRPCSALMSFPRQRRAATTTRAATAHVHDCRIR